MDAPDVLRVRAAGTYEVGDQMEVKYEERQKQHAKTLVGKNGQDSADEQSSCETVQQNVMPGAVVAVHRAPQEGVHPIHQQTGTIQVG